MLDVLWLVPLGFAIIGRIRDFFLNFLKKKYFATSLDCYQLPPWWFLEKDLVKFLLLSSSTALWKNLRFFKKNMIAIFIFFYL